MLSNKFWVLIVQCMLASIVSSKMKVTSPSSLQSKFEQTKGEIQSQYANFGHIPYGQSLVSLHLDSDSTCSMDAYTSTLATQQGVIAVLPSLMTSRVILITS